MQVKTNLHYESVPFILYSRSVTDEMQQQAYQAGATAVLAKPYKFPDFVALVTKALQ